MFWQERNASFRGVEFYVRTDKMVVGRRRAKHEYPQRDEPYSEDMGRKARDFSCEAIVVGSDYGYRRDKLIEALEKGGPGQLVHPYYGTKMVTVGDCSVSHSSDEGGMSRFALTFDEAGESRVPVASKDTKVQLENVQTSALAAVKEDFLSQFSIDKLPSWSVGDIQKSLIDLTGVGDFLPIAGMALDFQRSISGLMANPGRLVDNLFSMIRQVLNVDGLLSKPFLSYPKTSGVQSVGGVVRQQQALVTVLIKRAALVQQAGLLANAERETVSEVQGARQQLLEVFDAHDYARGNPRPSTEVARQLRQLRTAALAQLSNQSVALPRTYETTLNEPLPALALSYAIYGDLRDSDIVRRNAVRHPGFVPAGQPLQLTTE